MEQSVGCETAKSINGLSDQASRMFPNGELTEHTTVCLLHRVPINLCRGSEGRTWFPGSASPVHAHNKCSVIHVQLLGAKKVASKLIRCYNVCS
jgi:hypothetical protein